MYIEKLASSIRNDVVSGLRGYHQNQSMNMDQLEDEVVACRLEILHQNFLKGVLPIKDLLIAINCVDVDCKSLERCSCREFNEDDTLVAHFEIPQLISYYGKQAIEYIGSVDRQNKFQVVTSLNCSVIILAWFEALSMVLAKSPVAPVDSICWNTA